MNKAKEELFVVVRCCGRPARIVRGRPAAVLLLGDPARKMNKDRKIIAEFLEGKRDSLDSIWLSDELGYDTGSHYFDVVPAEEA